MVVSISDRQQMNSVILLPFELEVQMVLEYKKHSMQQFLLIIYILFLQRNVFESVKNEKKELNFLRTKKYK